MPVESQHTEYSKVTTVWHKCRTVLEGEEAVKAAGAVFLPPLSGQTAQEYAAYRDRALFFSAASRTREAMVGAIMRVPPITKFPESFSPILKTVSKDGRSLEAFTSDAVEELFTTGRFGVLVDSDESGARPYLAGYSAESIINWRVRLVDGIEVLDLVVLEEQVSEPKDEFDTTTVPKLRVLRLDDAGVYTVEVYRKAETIDGVSKSKWIRESTVQPTIRGQRLAMIPFVIIGVKHLNVHVCRPPLLDLVNVNISHYRSSADLEHGRHFTALPTPWAAGFDRKFELFLGSSAAWVSEDSSARCGFLEFTGQGLRALENALKEKQQIMAVLGARLLEGDKNAVEAAETQRVRKSSEMSILASVSNNVGEGLRRALEWLRDWLGASGEVDIDLNDDFTDFSITPEMMRTLMEQVQAGMISWDTYFFNLQRGNVLPDGRTKDEEQAMIELGNPISPTSDMGMSMMGMMQPAPNEAAPTTEEGA